MVKRIMALALLIFLLLSSQSALAAEGDTGEIQGAIINRTEGTSSSVAEQTVALKTYKGNAGVGTETSLTDQDGNFVFTGLSTDSSYIYQIEITYQGAGYYSQPVQFGAGESTKSTEISVYDTTTTDEGVNAIMSHVILSKLNDNLAVKEYYLFANTGDRTYIGIPSSFSPGKNETLKFSVPQEMTNLKLAFGLSDTSIIRDGNGFTDTDAVTPEGREISFSYEIPIQSGKQALYWTLEYDIMRFDFLLQDNNIGVTSETLSEQQPLNISGTSYRDYASEGLKRGDTISVTLAGLVTGSSSNYIYLAWLALLPVAGLVFFLVKRKKAIPDTAEDDKEQLMREIASLDDSYEAGEISEEEYQKLRKQKKQQLVELVRMNKDIITDDGANKL